MIAEDKNTSHIYLFKEEDFILKKDLTPKTLWTLFKSMFVLSACTFGGGFVIVSLMKKKFVEELKWLEEDEMLDITAITQSLSLIHICSCFPQNHIHTHVLS